MKNPWMKFYPTDWRADPRLRMCSLAARGLWIELICYMHEAEPYGHLLFDGKPLEISEISSLLGCKKSEIKKAFCELLARGVCTVSESGVVQSRRMIRDFERSLADKKNGKNGGNPKLGVNGGVNPPVKGGDKAQKLEARSQKLELEKKPSRETESVSVYGAVAEATRPTHDKIFDQEFWPSYPKRAGANPKAPARKVFLAAVKAGHDPAAIVEGARRCALADVKKIGTEFIPQAVKWLRDRRWEDYPAPAPASNQPAYLTPPPGCESLEVLRERYRRMNGYDTQGGTSVWNDAGLGDERPDRPPKL